MTKAVRHFLPVLGLLVLFGLPFAGQADVPDLSSPAGRVLLTVSGDIAVTNEGDTAQFDRDMLQDLETRTFSTTTIWTEGPQEFVGVTLQALMQRLGAEDGAIRALAINDYAVNIPVEDVRDGSALVAFLRNGQPMSVRDKGPLWIVYPFDESSRFRSETYHARSIWQLNRIEVLP